MPIDDLTALGQKMREARKNKELTQQELSDLSHVSVKQIANIEKGKMNPSYLILRPYLRYLPDCLSDGQHGSDSVHHRLLAHVPGLFLYRLFHRPQTLRHP